MADVSKRVVLTLPSEYMAAVDLLAEDFQVPRAVVVSHLLRILIELGGADVDVLEGWVLELCQRLTKEREAERRKQRTHLALVAGGK